MKRDPATPATPARRPRGRPRSFDREQALDRAMEVFWEKGFEAASLADLTRAMDINAPSLYAAFGDKEQLFLEAVERYTSRRRDSCDYCHEATAKEAVETLLTYMAEELSSSSHPRGCLMMMASTTTAGASPKLQAALAKLRASSRAKLRERIVRGIADGELPADTDATALANFYGTVLTGMSLMARDGVSRKALLGTVEAAMRGWPEKEREARPARDKVAAA
jgi:AcrR family transcriptional regulator